MRYLIYENNKNTLGLFDDDNFINIANKHSDIILDSKTTSWELVFCSQSYDDGVYHKSLLVNTNKLFILLFNVFGREVISRAENSFSSIYICVSIY